MDVGLPGTLPGNQHVGGAGLVLLQAFTGWIALQKSFCAKKCCTRLAIRLVPRFCVALLLVPGYLPRPQSGVRRAIASAGEVMPPLAL